MSRFFFIAVLAVGLLTGCVTSREYLAPDAHIVIGARLEPRMREGAGGLFTSSMRGTVVLERHPRRKDVRAQVVHLRAGEGWVYHVLPVVSGFYVIDSIAVRSGGVDGVEVTRAAKTSETDVGRVSVKAAFLFDVPKGSVAYIGSFDIEASGIPVEIEQTQNLEQAKAAAEKAGLDPASILQIERNAIRGKEKAPPKDTTS